MEDYLLEHVMELAAIIIAVVALIVSFVSMHYSRKAFALSLFDKRYKLFHDFKILVNNYCYTSMKNLFQNIYTRQSFCYGRRNIFSIKMCTIYSMKLKNISLVVLCILVPQIEWQRANNLKILH